MTIRIQKPNIFDTLLGLFGKKRGFVLKEEDVYTKWGPYAAFVIPRENFLKALFRSGKQTSENVLYDIQEIEDRLEGIKTKKQHSK